MAKPTGAVCNLDCEYCFFLSKEILYPGSRFRMAADLQETYIRQLLEAHERAPEVVVAWQGGEPTMMGLDFFRRAIDLERTYARPGQRVLNTIHTNGTLLTEEWGEFLKANEFLAGISIDGPPAMHDAYRVDKGGKPTFDRRVAASARRGGFVLLVGGSSVGKTRSAAEAVKAVLPEWWLVQPAGPAEVAALAEAPPARTVVWLDGLERYLDGENGLTGAVVRALLSAPRPVVIIGTLWPDRYTIYAAVPASGGADPHARERDVLGLAAVARIGPVFSTAEQGRARAAAGRDPRLRIALEAAGYGLTQTLAAAPQLVARWEDARTASPYGWAVLTAALDAARLGARAPLSADFLRAAAPGYCTSQQQAEAPGNWFEEARVLDVAAS